MQDLADWLFRYSGKLSNVIILIRFDWLIDSYYHSYLVHSGHIGFGRTDLSVFTEFPVSVYFVSDMN